MHHAYPSDCPYPHAAGTTRPVTQDEWLRMYAHLHDAEATPQEQAFYVYAKTPTKPLDQQDIPWSFVEELVAVHRPVPGHAGEYIRIAVCLLILLFFALSLMSAIPALRRRPQAKPTSTCV